MKSRERVLAALDFREPDRVPVDVWGSASRICDQLYYEIVNREEWTDFGPYVAASRSGNYVDPQVSDLIGSDIRHTNVGKPKNFKAYKDENGNDVNEWGIPMKKVSGEPVIALHPLKDADVADIDKHAWPTPADPGRIVGVKEQVEHWRNNTDYFVATTSVVSGLMIDIGPYLRSFEQFFMDLYINKEFAHKLIGRITDLLIEYYTYFLEPIGPLVDWVEFSSDHGMQDRALISVDTYREFFKEPYARLFREVKKAAPNAKIWMHSCGAVRDLIPEFIDVGVDILNSLQPRATGMDSLELKKEFGREIVFHGGLDIQGGVNGTVQEAIDETRRRLDAFMPGGGYIFAPSNHYMEDVPIDNFYAIHETVREYGVY